MTNRDPSDTTARADLVDYFPRLFVTRPGRVCNDTKQWQVVDRDEHVLASCVTEEAAEAARRLLLLEAGDQRELAGV